MIADRLRELTAKLADGDRAVRLRAVRSIRLILDWGGPNSPIPLGTQEDPDALEYCTAAMTEGHSLIAFGQVVLPPLTRAKDDDVEAELALLEVVGSFREAFPPLVLALRRGSVEGAWAIRYVGKALVSAGFDDSADGRVVLGCLVDELRVVLRENSEISIDAAHGLGQIGPSAAAAVPDLIAALIVPDHIAATIQSTKGRLILQAAYALGAIGTAATEAIPALEKLTYAADAAIRRAGEDALRMTRGKGPETGIRSPAAARADRS